MGDLSDFGAGVDDDPGPEDEVRIKLSRWLSGFGVEVYWDQKPAFGYSTFSPGKRARPDLLVRGSYNTYAIEVKIGDDSSDIHDALPQTVEYWETVADGKANYRVDGKSVDVDAFLLATKNSPFGRLFKAEGEKEALRTETSKGRQRAVQAGQLPEREFSSTETAIRAMWRFAKARNAETDLGIGALLSSRLDGDGNAGVDESDPYALYYCPGGYQPESWDEPSYQFWEPIPGYMD